MSRWPSLKKTMGELGWRKSSGSSPNGGNCVEVAVVDEDDLT
ncbi:uncharacterized protein DUF397 [Actinoallomurus bryophytorum]|uniref:Uncharacterized protein DUF397 n=1 Tax=Actinoallomurus bryophytorum TaxID=1490222 RepID=A0A543CVQ1_9ACTN|nr:DUF397 domain-containing protein [Actinoallomurus bryophytorum]TQM01129.1 uncharacterized protein DUF397 [Actinoallomurus bryophytorum]